MGRRLLVSDLTVDEVWGRRDADGLYAEGPKLARPAWYMLVPTGPALESTVTRSAALYPQHTRQRRAARSIAMHDRRKRLLAAVRDAK